MPTDILNLRTLSFVMMLAMIVSSLIMSFVTLTQRTYPGFGLWTIGNLLASVGFFLLGVNLAPRKRVEQRRLPCIRITDERDQW